MMSNLWIVAVLGVFAVLAMCICKSENLAMRRAVLTVITLLFMEYLYWRITKTVAWFDFDFDGIYTQVLMFVEIFWFLEVAHNLHFYLYKEKLIKKNVSALDRTSSIDVVIPTFNEPIAILERTLMATKGLVWPGTVQIYVLDDGKREWLPALCKKWDAKYISRPNSSSAKAGNINHALTYLHGDFTLILDADFLVAPNAIEKLVAPMSDKNVAVVQAPQEFYNPDPIQRSLGISVLSPNDQSHFFNGILHARSNGDAAFFCGSCGLIRNSALKKLGGFPTESITEDIFLSIKLKQLGFESVTIQEPVAVGLAPETINDMIKQRSRWGEGAMQMNSKLWEFSANEKGKHGFLTQLKFFPVYWIVSYPVRFISLLIPQCYFLFGWSALTKTSLLDLVVAQGALVLTLISFNFWISKKRLQPFITTVWHDLLALRLTPKFLLKFTLPYKESAFHVTPKGQVVAQHGHPRSFDLMVRFLVIVTLASLLIAIAQVDKSSLGVVSFFWVCVNFIRLLFVNAALRNEKKLTPFELEANGEEVHQLWIERGQNFESLKNCVVSESRIIDRKNQPIGDALIQIMTSEGLANIGYTYPNGQIHYFGESSKAIWLSKLVEANISAFSKSKSELYSSSKAFMTTLMIALRIKHV
jgi:cellulose synthase (UDP-forming)